MQKIPTIFVRDFRNNGKITREWNPDCFAVRDGLAVATVKFDGTSCMIRDGRLYKRYEGKVGKPWPANFEPADEPDETTGKYIGWVPVGMGPEDQWHREAMEEITNRSSLIDGTYELIGPKIQGNPENSARHILIPHGLKVLTRSRTCTYDDLQAFLTTTVIEGIVWWMGDKPVGKIKRRDFGLPWPVKN